MHTYIQKYCIHVFIYTYIYTYIHSRLAIYTFNTIFHNNIYDVHILIKVVTT